METSVKAAEVLIPPQPDKMSSLQPESSEGEACPSSSSSDSFGAMEEFCRRLQDIISTHGSAARLLDQQSVEEEEEEEEKEVKGDPVVSTETDVSLIKQSLEKLSSPEEKLEELVGKHADLAALRRSDEQKMVVLQQKMEVFQQKMVVLQAENQSSVTARSKLEALCRELQVYHNTTQEETLQRCREDEEKRKEMSSHFQEMLTEIQAQIEQHSGRNDKLRLENCNLTEKVEKLMMQCERGEESLEKINKHHELQLKLTEAKLQQANALLTEAEEKHGREKEYLLVQAAEWKLQAQTLREQGTVMQAQLTLYAQKFDDFQETLAKSNEIYVRFRKEMNNMSDKMKKVEKESGLWKTRFENCNKALTDMIEERSEKGKEYELFVLKIQKLEKLCRALQDERKVLYEKIKEVRNSSLPSKCSNSANTPEGADESAVTAPEEVQEDDPVLTENMARLKEEQAKLQEFAASLLAKPDFDDPDEEELNLDEDIVASAFAHFKTKPQERQSLPSEPEPAAEPSEKAQKTSSETVQTDPHVEHEVQKQLGSGDRELVKEELKHPEPEPETTKVDPEPEPKTTKADPEPKPKDTKANPEPQPETTKADSEPETTKADPEPEPKTTKADQEPQPETTKADPEPQPETTKADPEPQPETTKADSEPETTKADPEPEIKISQENSEQHETEPEPVPQESGDAASSKKQMSKKKKKRNGKSTSQTGSSDGW